MSLLDRLVEHALQVPLGESGTFHVLHSLDVLCYLHSLLILNWRHLTLSQLFAHFGVVSQVELGAYEDDGNAGCVVLDFRVPLVVISKVLAGDMRQMRTLALTLSNDDGLTMEKQMRKTSV